VSMFKSYLWLGSASLPSQTCAHHGGETDTEINFTTSNNPFFKKIQYMPVFKPSSYEIC
jgi:hypothetical protein